MLGDTAEVTAANLSDIIDTKKYRSLFLSPEKAFYTDL